MKLILSLFFFVSIAAAQPDVKLPFTPQPRLPMSELSHQSAQVLGWWGSGKMLWKEEVFVTDTIKSAQKVGLRSPVDSSVIQFRFVTAQDFFDYEAECYADSTRNGYDRIAIVGGKRVRLPLGDHYKRAELDPLGCIEIVEHYDHREPTLPGFIKWLWRQK